MINCVKIEMIYTKCVIELEPTYENFHKSVFLLDAKKDKMFPIEQNISHLQKLITYANQRLVILPGAGIHYGNVEAIVTTLNSNEAHGTRIVRI